MAFNRVTVYWDTRDFDSDIGSVLVSRSNDGELGSYANISTLPSGSPTFIGSYIGSSTEDKITSWYRIQVLDSGAGSSFSGSSDPIRPLEGKLTSISEVKDIARLSLSADITDYEIIRYIQETDDIIFENYGDPTRRSYFFFDSSIGSTVYDFTGDRVAVHNIRELRVDGEPVPQSSGSWVPGYNQGFIQFDSTFIANNDGLKVSIDWIPKAFNTLATYQAALDLVDSGQIIDGEEVRNPLALRLKQRVGSIENAIMPKHAFGSDKFKHWDENDESFVHQWEHFDT